MTDRRYPTPQGEETNGAVDPAPKPVNIISERAQRFVSDISNATLDELRQLRDQIDDAMRIITKRRDKCFDSIMDFAEDTNAAVAMKNVVGEAMEKLQDRLAQTVEDPPPPTVSVPQKPPATFPRPVR